MSGNGQQPTASPGSAADMLQRVLQRRDQDQARFAAELEADLRSASRTAVEPFRKQLSAEFDAIARETAAAARETAATARQISDSLRRVEWEATAIRKSSQRLARWPLILGLLIGLALTISGLWARAALVPDTQTITREDGTRWIVLTEQGWTTCPEGLCRPIPATPQEG